MNRRRVQPVGQHGHVDVVSIAHDMEDRFLQAITGGDVETVRAMLADEPALAGARNADGLSAVLLAGYHGHGEVRDALLAAEPPLDALELAAIGDADGLRARLAADPEALHARAPDGFTPLHYAAFFGGADAVRVLLAAGAAPDADADNELGVRPLHSAAARGDREAAVALLDAGAEPNPRQQGGYTPLHAAAHNDDALLAAVLLAHGADPALQTDDGRDARALAGERVAALLSATASVVVRDLHDIAFSRTAALFQGGPEAGTTSTLFIVRTPPGGFVHLHVHPYPETFVMLEGAGRWTAGDTVAELQPDQVIVVPPATLHGFRNIGDVPLLVVSVHESPTLQQTFTQSEPA
jgi:uncharacterized protein